MKRVLKILSIVLLVLLVISFSTGTVFAKEITPGSLKAEYGDSENDTLTTTAGKIMGMIRNIAVIASVIVIMVLGVKYILGSVEEKAEYKKAFMPLIIGIILVVSATSIASFIFGMVEVEEKTGKVTTVVNVAKY